MQSLENMRQQEKERLSKCLVYKCVRCGNDFQSGLVVAQDIKNLGDNKNYCPTGCYDEYQTERRVKYYSENAEKILFEHNFPNRFLMWDKETLNPKMKKVLDDLDPAGFFLCGKTGSGKTCLSVVFAKELTKTQKNIYFQNVPELLFEIKGTFDQENKVFNDYGLICKWAEKPYLILDDLGAEKVTEYVRQSLYTLINKRYLDNLPTFITSNLSLDEISARLDDRIASRIFEMCGQPINLGSEDLRLKRHGGKQ